MKKLSIYLCSLLMAFAVSCSQPEPEVAPASPETSIDKGARKAARTKKAITKNITGAITATDPVTGVPISYPYTATYRINKFIEKNGKVYAVGSVTSVLFQLAPTQAVSDAAAALQAREIQMQVMRAKVDGAPYVGVPTTQALSEAVFQLVSQQAVCEILFLELGPLELNLLGLEIDLNQVVLEIVANTAGGLLGDLLCLVANLLDGGLLIGELLDFVNLLNAIIDLIGSI